ncbi:hypothetical protein [Leifsonia sp. Le1]
MPVAIGAVVSIVSSAPAGAPVFVLFRGCGRPRWATGRIHCRAVLLTCL